MLLELERRVGWRALGHKSWRECAITEFGTSKSRVYELLAAAKVEEQLQISGIPENEIPTTVSQLNELAKLPPEQQVAGLKKADELAAIENRKRTVEHVSRAVKQLQPQPRKHGSGSGIQEDSNSKKFSRARSETAQSAKRQGLPSSSAQFLPSVERNHHSPADVDERPKATSASPIEINTDEICIGLIGNVPYLTDDQIIACYQAIAHRISLEALGLGHWSDAELKRMIEAAKRELERRHHPD